MVSIWKYDSRGPETGIDRSIFQHSDDEHVAAAAPVVDRAGGEDFPIGLDGQVGRIVEIPDVDPHDTPDAKGRVDISRRGSGTCREDERNCTQKT
jgi:hypothetical protein